MAAEALVWWCVSARQVIDQGADELTGLPRCGPRRRCRPGADCGWRRLVKPPEPLPDLPRLAGASAKLHLVWCAVADGGWHQLADIAYRTGIPEQSVSMRLRELRAEPFNCTVDRRRVERKLDAPFEYQVTPPTG